MIRVSRLFVMFVIATAAMLPAGARAQFYGAPAPSASLYPYAVQIAPGTYEIRRPQRDLNPKRRHEPARLNRRAAEGARNAMRNDPALVEELRQRRGAKRAVIHTKKIVHDKPVVIETTRVVDDPPKVIERRHYVDDSPPVSAPRRKQTAERAREPLNVEPPKREGGKKRVIEADAEVTILGPDRMSIRLFRKRRGGDAKASAE